MSTIILIVFVCVIMFITATAIINLIYKDIEDNKLHKTDSKNEKMTTTTKLNITTIKIIIQTYKITITNFTLSVDF